MPKVILLILDGYGIAPHGNGNAISNTHTPNIYKLISRYPAMTLITSRNDLGLSKKEVPTCAISHLIMGTGRVEYNNQARINMAINNFNFFSNDVLLKTIQHVKDNNSNLHLVGVLNKDSSYGDVNHIYALLYLCKRQKLSRVYIHGIIEGDKNDSLRVLKSIKEVLARIKRIGVGDIVTLSGDFYAMDRFSYFNRIEKTYKTMIASESKYVFNNIIAALDNSYASGLYASGLIPTKITYGDKNRLINIFDNDSVVFYNHRGDSLRELAAAFIQPDFNKFFVKQLKNTLFVTMTDYGLGVGVPVVYPQQLIKESLAKMISEADMSQLHLASVEKYPYVTYFFNGGDNTIFTKCDNILINIKSSEISNEAKLISKHIIANIEKQSYNFIVANFSAIDLIAHTGNFQKTRKTIETIDNYIGDIVESSLMNNTTVVITSDHGYSENLLDTKTEIINKEHSSNPVPLIIVSRELEGKTGCAEHIEHDLSALHSSGTLKDVAPTVAKLLGLKSIPEVEGRALV